MKCFISKDTEILDSWSLEVSVAKAIRKAALRGWGWNSRGERKAFQVGREAGQRLGSGAV